MSQTFNVIITNLPGLAVAGIGLLYAMLHWERCPRVAVPVILGCLALLVSILVRPVVSNVVVRVMPNDMEANELRMYVFNGLHFVFNVLEACGVGAFLYAAFFDRDPVVATLASPPPKGL